MGRALALWVSDRPDEAVRFIRSLKARAADYHRQAAESDEGIMPAALAGILVALRQERGELRAGGGL